MKAILEIFSKSQENISTHQKLLQRLKKIYKEGELNSVVSAILICVDVIFLEDYKTFHKRRTRVLAFLGQFLLDFLAEDTDEEAENPIVRTVIDRVLNHTEAVNPNLRYHSTRLLEVILKNISANVQVSAQLCDDIQDHLIDRLDTDSVLPIRVMSTSALEKLQDIDNSRCPVIDAYCRLCNDPNPTMRKLAVTHIAVTHSTRETLIKLTRDMDSMVRCEAFKRVSSINPSSFLKIIQRQQVIINGIEEEQLSVRKVFLNKLLPQWLKMYDDNLISFYNSVMLDAHQNDIEDTRKIHRELMKIFFTQFSAGEILQYLPIGTDALVPVNQLTSVISAYWYYFVVNLQNGDNFSVELENVLPQLTPLCEYITSVIKSKEGIHLEEWQKVQFQEVLYNLFNMVAISDLADEIGRKHLQPLLRETLVNVKLDKSVIEVILETYKAFFTDTEQLSIDICTIMSEIRESVIANEEEIALNNTQRMEIMASQFNLYSDTMCRCLDILSIFLKKTKFQQLPLSLRVCLNELVRPAMQSEDINVHGRIFLVLGQFCVLDKNIAMEDAHYICSPLIATKYGRYDKNSIIPSVQAISDIICVHGTEILGDEIEESFNVTSINSSQLRRRKLYQEVPAEEILAQCMNVTRGLIMDIMLDLLEEEDDDIRHLAAKSLMKLVMKGLLVNSSLLTRIMLKWLNPCIEKHDPAMQQTIGDGLLHYAMNIKNSNMIIYRAIVPILNTIGNAPENSPFGDVVVESVLMYLHNMIQLQSTDNFDVDKNLMLDIIQEIKNRPKTKSTYILSKMLLVLKLPKETDENFLADCTKEVDIAIQFVIDVKVRKLLIKFKQQLNTLHKSTENSRAVEVTATESIANGTILTNSEADEINLNSRATNNENADCTSDSDESTLVNSIIEDSFSSTDSSVKKRTAKNRTLRVLIERTSINKLKQLAKSQKSATETPALKASKRKRGRPSNGSRRDLSELLETSNMHMLTRSGRKVRTPAISESSEECISRKSRRQS